MTIYTSELKHGDLGRKCPLSRRVCAFTCAWFHGSENYGRCIINSLNDSGVYLLDEIRDAINSVANNVST